MPYIFLVKGVCLSTKDIENNVLEKLESHDSFKILVNELAKKNLILKTSYNYDIEVASIFLGEELYTNQRIYQGLTTVFDAGEEKIFEELKPYLVKIKEILFSLSNLTFTEKAGLILNQFD